MVYNPSTKITSSFWHFRIFVSIIKKEVLLFVPEADINVHAWTVVKGNRLRHHRSYHIIFFCNIFNNILVALNRIGCIHKCVVPNINFTLTSSCDFVMMSIANDTKIVTENVYTFISIIHQSVTRCTWKISFF